MIEIDFSTLSRQCLHRRILSINELGKEGRVNKFQESNAFHPYIWACCDKNKVHYGGRLIAKNEGFVCPYGNIHKTGVVLL